MGRGASCTYNNVNWWTYGDKNIKILHCVTIPESLRADTGYDTIVCTVLDNY